MAHLKEIGKVVYLRLSLQESERRLADKDIFRRGVVMKRKGETLAQLYAERAPLYEKYADVVVDCDGLNIDGTVAAIMAGVGKQKN